MNFKDALQARLDANSSLKRSAFGKGLTTVIGHRLAIKRMERVAKVHLGYDANDTVDWSVGMNWTSLLAFLKEILPLIMALFGL